MTADELRKKYPVFEYKSSKYKIEGEDLVCAWEMRAGELEYHPKLIIHNVPEITQNLDNLVFNLGLADIFSYWKATCSPKIVISAGKLNPDQIAFWHDLLIKGMGQYFYTNQIDFRAKDFVVILSDSEGSLANASKRKPVARSLDSARDDRSILIPVGGGKDSAVTLELLKNQPKVGAFSLNVSWSDRMLPASKRLMAEAGIKEQIYVERILDPAILNPDFLTGHIPISAYLNFLSVFLARLFGYSEVSFSNERSSNEANLAYLGVPINHQYSKSFEFEKKFQKYNLSYLSNVNVFSFLRPLYELQIMKIFSKLPAYFPLFRSCNIGYKNDSWCGQCPKCLAVFVGLFPFVKNEQLLSIFGKNLFEDTKLNSLINDVLGQGSGKPFECIGTFEETKVAFYLSKQQVKGEDLENRAKKILTAWDAENLLPPDYQNLLKQAL